MTIDLIIIATLAIVALIATIVLVARDGYRRIPTRTF